MQGNDKSFIDSHNKQSDARFSARLHSRFFSRGFSARIHAHVIRYYNIARK